MTYIPGTLLVISGPAPDLLEEAGAPLLQIGWDELRARDINNDPVSVVIQYQARINNIAGEGSTLINQAAVKWSSLPGDLSTPQTPNNPLSTERFYDPGDSVDIYGANISLGFRVPKYYELPQTGFAPDVVTYISPSLQKLQLWTLETAMDIPSLGVNLPIVGVPASENGWDLTWAWLQSRLVARDRLPDLGRQHRHHRSCLPAQW